MPLILKIGAGFGLMGVSVLIADCVMLHCTKDRKMFQKMKELDIKETVSILEPNNNNNNNVDLNLLSNSIDIVRL
jgi:hypothetical protein